MNKLLFKTFAPLSLLILLALPALAQVHDINPAQARQLMNTTPDLVILDIRTPDEFHQGHIKGSVNIDFFAEDFNEKINMLDKTKPYFIYCRSGQRSHVATSSMDKNGFVEIHNLTQGINAWTDKGYPLTRK
ncbi:rhodanese-like domain-containing protein [Pseudodesulfovibrio piezophilus]|uniref:Rhodanese domain protein n=1 Tax=Pseudodesulfovibrio piezophilus (strain DSM 21447 / JCM 15486 / C1TLV30) TaxID=1322246 RepID=M1WJN2_PSEP2|nr:rhodanese-like domain-containing protein [Pseudodesulfovibrio piezophilus]CCH48191.1 Rhodanese domain protein [Pseudodesulfovibrio piezophilus C1TLV30]